MQVYHFPHAGYEGDIQGCRRRNTDYVGDFYAHRGNGRTGAAERRDLAALEKLETHERRPTTYALVLLALVSIRGAAMKMDLDEPQFLAEIAKGVGVDI